MLTIGSAGKRRKRVTEEINALQSEEQTMDEFTYLRSEEEESAWLQEQSEGLHHSIAPVLSTNTDEEEIRELNAVFDEVLAELIAEEAEAARAGKPIPQRREAAPESAASIEEVHMEDVHKRLRELLPKRSAAGAKDKTLAPPEFDEDLYEQLIPLFIAILNHIQKTAT